MSGGQHADGCEPRPARRPGGDEYNNGYLQVLTLMLNWNIANIPAGSSQESAP